MNVYDVHVRASSTKYAAKLLAAFCLVGSALIPAAAQTPAAPKATSTTPATPAPAPLVTPVVIYGNIGERPAIVHDTPQLKTAAKTYIFGAHRAVEILVKLGDVVKVRDADGTVGWIEPSALGTARYTEVNVGGADVRASPAATAALVFEAAKGVSLEITGPANDGWLPVKHRDGQAGYIKTAQVFGF